MMQRVWILTVYFTKSLFFSLTGLILLILSLVYWVIFFPPGQGTPDVENYIILIAAFGAAATFVAALSLSGRASRLENYPLLVRLPSRVEYLVAVLFSALLLGVGLQLLVAALALIRGPDLSGHALMIPPLWLSLNILAAVLAMHASDLVTAGWSRVIVFGLLAVLLLLKGVTASPDSWLANRLFDASSVLIDLNLLRLSDLAADLGIWISSETMEAVSRAAGIVFWPFQAMSDAVFAGGFNAAQALGPAVLLLYGSILFLIAATLFAGKDLDFTE
ncbi:MAG: hypothetical protein IPH95_04385 [Candidatus Promineofilum sp.]|nr:hypothetical protein [Promineifilum sp.]